MSRKSNLLSIGEISKYTGAGIKALRYYERINILKPAYIDPDSGYRYYSFGQTYLVSLIMFCIELDIPLKELTEYIDGQEIINFQEFLAHGRKVADKKMKALKKGLRFIDFMQRKIALQEQYPFEQIYTRELPEKYFCVIPYEQTFENADQYEVSKLFSDIPYDEYEDYEWLEYGFLCEHLPSGIQRYVFIEVPHNKINPECKIIPGGQFYCRQSDVGQIEQTADIFKNHLAKGESFIAIETEVFSGKVDANKLINEVRVIKNIDI
jgi:DNA-binding transcriptional MerR regulator